MTFKEFKKIISNKWIPFFLVALCIFNIFFQITYWQDREDALQTESEIQEQKIINYPNYISDIKKNMSTISSFKLFNKDGDYNTKSAEKVVKAYDNVKDVKPVYGNYTAISIFTRLGFSDVIIFVIVLQCAAVLINNDRKNGMLTLLKSCKNGRFHLMIGKIKALFIADVVCVITVYLSLLIGMFIYYGCDNLNVPIQSVPDFYESFLPITVLQYLLLFIALKCIAVFFYSLILLCLVIVFQNLGIFYSVTGIFLVVAMLANNYILWDYKLAIFKMISSVTLTDTAALTYKYYNINVFGNPFNLLGVALIIMLVGILVCGSIAIIIFSKNMAVNIVINRFRHIKKREKRLKGINTIEYKKLIWINKGAIIIALLVIMQIFTITNIDTEMSDYQKCYAAYMSKLEGKQTEETNKIIHDEQNRFKDIQKEYDKNIQLYMKGKMNSIAFDTLEDQYTWDMIPEEAFKSVKKHKEYLDRIEQERGVKGWFVNDIGIEYLINPSQSYNETVVWIFMMMAILLLTISCFAYEEETGMICLTNTMLYGRRKLYSTKVKVAFIMTTIIFIITNIPFVILAINNYSFSGIMAPIYSLMKFEKCPFSIPILFLLIAIYLLKYFIAMLATIIVIGVTKKCRGYIKKITVSFMILVMPLIVIALY